MSELEQSERARNMSKSNDKPKTSSTEEHPFISGNKETVAHNSTGSGPWFYSM